MSGPPPPAHVPKRWIAIVLSMVSTGLGHVYIGDTGRGLIWAAVPMAWTALVTIAMRPIGAALGYRAFLVLMIAPLIVPWGCALASLARISLSKRVRAPWLRVVLLGVGLFIASRTLGVGLKHYTLEAFKIPSGSMIPTLLVGDHLFIDKALYRSRAPRRGEVIVFEYPERPEQHFVKRVIALPGDRLEVKNGHPWINGWEVPSCLVGLYAYEELDTQARHEGDLFVEFLGDEAYLTLYDKGFGAVSHHGPFDAKPNDYWVLGDNRNNAHDSRMWWGGQGGGVPMSKVTGRAVFAYFSSVESGLLMWRVGLDVKRPNLPPEMKDLSSALAACMQKRPTVLQATPP